MSPSRFVVQRRSGRVWLHVSAYSDPVAAASEVCRLLREGMSARIEAWNGERGGAWAFDPV